MTTIDYTLTPDQLSNAVDNTIRVFDEYSLGKKMDSEGRQMIFDSSWMGMFRYHITETPDGSKLTLEAMAAKPVSPEELAGHEESFLKNLFKIMDKEIMITPEIANTDIYKTGKITIGLRSIMWIALIIILILKTVQGCTKN